MFGSYDRAWLSSPALGELAGQAVGVNVATAGLFATEFAFGDLL